MPIEKENLACRSLVRPTRDRISKFVRELNFLGPVSRGVERHWKEHRSSKVNKMKKIEADVAAVVKHLKATLGATWAQASVPRAQANSRLLNPARTLFPGTTPLTRGADLQDSSAARMTSTLQALMFPPA